MQPYPRILRDWHLYQYYFTKLIKVNQGDDGGLTHEQGCVEASAVPVVQQGNHPDV